ncbi:TPA: DUF596 domain-containing protein [Proteus mirabilis]|uniref:DUF596 domain-containing protein n=1 Tax=Proteus mirabilis TaxID=584 RepID=UPI0018C68E3D|nr:DUF596 domain-containing protein [Proteus mirabilis]MBJ5782557.1 DUF596 domain-containing protein [Salmonella enterica subsp. enterica serovar Derby]MBJ5791974.1 DUF596 domain-containing protein [Salmonella enterica subsp. enterica serovar Agona]MBG2744326.1 DUF596 domain-containing protein [Proteus mirabilis]MDM3843336.1 DUF596 domain-containing protein [Proteus mirabilis]HEK0805679.1 DUF596 domain-containing protein [Proteus mirabilis]
MVSNVEYKTIVEYAETQALDGLWAYITPDMLPSLHVICEDFSFPERKKIFFWFLKKLLHEGHLKLAKHGKFLSGSIDEQLQCFYDAFPETEEKLIDQFWFFDESCPGGAVWILQDGTLEWT